MTEIELKIINTHALDPGKVYLIEVDRVKISPEQQAGLAKALTTLGIRWVIIRSIGGDGIRMVEETSHVPTVE